MEIKSAAVIFRVTGMILPAGAYDYMMCIIKKVDLPFTVNN
jgi:hypothetical protein